ncbi:MULTISPECIES: glycosyltransferase [Desulfosporosinus]|uniref:Glycosyltransferase involved in cell wall bisynthesis n=1 Tax=Desulfosporosinus lacus DSM 15449 TaxID=1121420 RepID=A0A1M5RXW9_9FIRM|nr:MULTISPECIES: glycosyltransferase [Desulfosporosinus]MDA8221047.1 glycosyltransferase [Desulfitobacterium hafniense]SHH31085.1 Glycosyltransferase involved in cell wall bisynthesis [Desulfosporosinus lacus DSM 15449]
MRIVLDMQGAQSTGSRNRGIGRYTLSLAKAIALNQGEHEIILALNGLFPDTIEPIRAAFVDLLPQENILIWYAPGQVSSSNVENIWRRRVAELTREAFLARLNPDIVLISSLFEGFNDDAVTSIDTLSSTVPTAVILYDLIPLIHRQPYLENPLVESWYENKLGHLRRAKMLLAISESSRQESMSYLGFSSDNSINISTAAESHFQPKLIKTTQATEICQRYGLLRPFVMYTGGIDHRKNIEGLIRAYARLSKTLRDGHQLAVVCSIQPQDRERLYNIAIKYGLSCDEVIFTSFVPEEDLIVLYNLCKVFIFPSWHEGFGLPALEAMSCGKAVIGANTTSLPEVIGREDALFDPHSDMAITEKLTQVLVDDVFRQELEQYGIEQARKFSWENSAKQTIITFEKWLAHQEQRTTPICISPRRLKLAYISPLLPERSGISDYSAELLPELACYYDIDVIVAQDTVSDTWVKANCSIRSVEWFRANAPRYDRVLYHFGNSPFHQHMFALLDEIPGTVVLHDFFLSGIVSHIDFNGDVPNCWAIELYRAHGYQAMQERFHATSRDEVVWKYPCNYGVLHNARGIIVHSENSRRLAESWYGASVAQDWLVVPLLRIPATVQDRTRARQALNFDADDFIVCSFGLLGPIKLNERLLKAWLSSSLAKNQSCILVFAGENDKGDYGERLLNDISNSGLTKRIRVTGWLDIASFRQYLAAVDVGVQLRTLSRGETSGAVLDCMNYGLPTIVNANGSMADLPDDVVWKIPDEFSEDELKEALEVLWRDESLRQRLGEQAREAIVTNNAPRACAKQYCDAIEGMYKKAFTGISGLTQAIARIESAPKDSSAYQTLASCIAHSLPTKLASRQLLVDISVLVQGDAKSGIQRVVRSILRVWLEHPPSGWRVEPVYAPLDAGYRYARRFTAGFLGCPTTGLTDDPIEYRSGDLFLGLDLQHHVALKQQETYQQMRRHGTEVRFMVYDLLPLMMPRAFPEGIAQLHKDWLDVVFQSDGAVCISKAVANELSGWFKKNAPHRLRSFKIGWFHLGADIKNSVPSSGLSDDADAVIEKIRKRSSFLMVGTIEPRKGHAQTLEAMDRLWAKGVDANLVIVGKQGWKVEALIEKLRHHIKLNEHLFWLDGISDEYLEKVYAVSTCLIAASEGEGFGLPLVEAAQHKLPIIARDIPVFREVAAEHAFYFVGEKPQALADAIERWLTLDSEGKTPQSIGMPYLTWRESAQKLLNEVF